MKSARTPEGMHPASVPEHVIGVGRNPVAAWWTTHVHSRRMKRQPGLSDGYRVSGGKASKQTRAWLCENNVAHDVLPHLRSSERMVDDRKLSSDIGARDTFLELIDSCASGLVKVSQQPQSRDSFRVRRQPQPVCLTLTRGHRPLRGTGYGLRLRFSTTGV